MEWESRQHVIDDYRKDLKESIGVNNAYIGTEDAVIEIDYSLVKIDDNQCDFRTQI